MRHRHGGPTISLPYPSTIERRLVRLFRVVALRSPSWAGLGAPRGFRRGLPTRASEPSNISFPVAFLFLVAEARWLVSSTFARLRSLQRFGINSYSFVIIPRFLRGPSTVFSFRRMRPGM